MDGERVQRVARRRGCGWGGGCGRGDGRARPRLAAGRGGRAVAPHAGRARGPQPPARPAGARQPIQLSHTPQLHTPQGEFFHV